MDVGPSIIGIGNGSLANLVWLGWILLELVVLFIPWFRPQSKVLVIGQGQLISYCGKLK